MSPYSSHLQFATTLAREAGTLIRQSLMLGRDRVWKKDHTPVTDIDQSINDLVLSQIRQSYPEHNILAEEQNDTGKDSTYVWVCDPLDGTKAPYKRYLPGNL